MRNYLYFLSQTKNKSLVVCARLAAFIASAEKETLVSVYELY